MSTEISQELLDFIDRSPTCFHAVRNFQAMLTGFQPLAEHERWSLKPGGAYYITRGGSAIIAFHLPEGPLSGYQIAAAHSDCPLLKLKPNGVMVSEGHYLKLNVEKYGGLLCAPWLDRPLSVAGRLLVEENGGLSSRLVDLNRDIALIPNLAIHMNRQVNDGYAYQPQTDLLPLIGMGTDTASFPRLAAEAAGAAPETVLGSDLFLYNRMRGRVWGMENEFISSRSLDDLQCAWSLVSGLLGAGANRTHAAVCCVFDNEEVGSGTRQGADSTFLSDVLERINEALGGTVETLRTALASSMMISADNAHAVHPNHPEKADPTNRPYLNGGVVIKYNANQLYTTDGVSEALLKLLCRRAEVPYQTYANRSDIPGGSTLGHISTSHVSVHTVDIGLAQLAMHSPYETAGAQDTEYLVRLMREYYESAFVSMGDGKYSMERGKA